MAKNELTKITPPKGTITASDEDVVLVLGVVVVVLAVWVWWYCPIERVRDGSMIERFRG